MAVDCAHGVGSLWIGKYFSPLTRPFVKIVFNNTRTGTESLNKNVSALAGLTGQSNAGLQCGADFVKIQQQTPTDFENVPPFCRCASLDGDADRLLYFYRDEQLTFRVLDGDHIAALFALFLCNHLRQLGLDQHFSFGVVQTAYANGNSTRFFRDSLVSRPPP